MLRSTRKRKQPSCLCASTPVEQAKLDFYLDHLLPPKPPRRLGKHYGKTSDSKEGIIVDTTTIERKDFFSSPGTKVKNALRKHSFYRTPSKAKVTERSLNGSATKMRSNEVDYVRSLKVLLTFKVDEKTEEKVMVHFFQSAASASQPGKEFKITAEGQLKVEQCPRPLADEYGLIQEEHTVETLKKALHGKHKVTSDHQHIRADDFLGYFGFNIVANHSHLHRHTHGQKEVKPIDSLQGKGLITIPTSEKHNYLRLVSVEIPAVENYIEQLGSLFYSVRATLHKDTIGPIPVLKEEEACWEDELGNKITFKYKPEYHPEKEITPAHQLEPLNSILYDLVFARHRNLSNAFDEAADENKSDVASQQKSPKRARFH